ncbi:hypothetical protein J2S00_000411 [Caldalkalibacillus uzonensis]|uniref:Helicase XPB/Ssl2 N-terminal domain-containing protein n=1 Tax=Caldalkalibacillus uzonensis TaxID=353224 RepID=A0ABU0CMJ7_9BACI|nr:hypothetical protein [Caldalkalibacillus uzonensis]MDQ0337641.1 hypothetical protein [Caldalkalibacillus uzonensis]
MKLIDCLLQQDIGQLNRLASFYRCECNRHSKLELVQSIHFQLLNKQACQAALQELGDNLLPFVQFLIFQPKRTYSIEELMAKGRFVQSVTGIEAEPEQWLTQLIKRGWLFIIPDPCHKQIEIPLDIHHLLRQVLKNRFLHLVQPVPDEELQEQDQFKLRDERQAIVGDLFCFLRFVAADPVPLTKTGVIHRRFQQRLLNSFAVPEDPLGKQRWRFGYGRRFPAYPNRFALIYDFCYAQGWIMEGEHCLSLTPKGEHIVAAPSNQAQLIEQLTRYWLILYQKPIPSLPFLFELLTSGLNGQWIRADKLASLLSPWLKAYYFDDVSTLIQERILGMMSHLGLVMLLADESAGRYYVKIK